MPRTTTQPATVHAYYEAHVFAKTAGYLAELKVDIGTIVKQGDVLAVIAIPEMAKHREAKLATIRRLEANQRRAAAQLTVAQARAASYQAKLSKAQAAVGTYKDAYQSALIYDQLKEAVFTAEADQRIAELQTTFETAQKETTISFQQSQLSRQKIILILIGI